ncbi:hypothetical protein NPIL_85021 [Nephila pilipes]|uniref:Uncharacterized protein n=1 Tax=Nephila pilipes TaxID=299642 RepID=A0A8X6Q4V9_NEPPI|nr:hypothetical protein NPIL_85021 [Nephila pilipes]
MKYQGKRERFVTKLLGLTQFRIYGVGVKGLPLKDEKYSYGSLTPREIAKINITTIASQLRQKCPNIRRTRHPLRNLTPSERKYGKE